MPHIGGSDIAGVVDELGAGVEGVPVGSRVVVDPSLDYSWYDDQPRGDSFDDPRFRILGEHTQGGFAEYAIAPAANLFEIPKGFPATAAAAAGLVSVTAWRGLMTRAGLRAGESVLITGASGGVGTAAVQIAKLAGAKVYAVTSGSEKVEKIKKIGADVVYDRTKEDFAAMIRRDTEKRGVDVALDAVGEEAWQQCLQSLAIRGRLVSYGATTGARGNTEIRVLFWKQLDIMGSTMGTPQEFRKAMSVVFSGAIKPVIHEVVPLADTRRAHEMLEAGKVFGKLVITP
jgi:NADPH:quinone reductase-like Zn-dependent oxidoreductase